MGQADRAKRRWLVGFLVLAVTGCTSAPAPLPVLEMETYVFRQTQAGVRVALDPFLTASRTQPAFHGGEDFGGKGLLPVQVIIENDGTEDVQVNSQDFRLVHPTGRSEPALSAYEAFSMVKLSMGWWALAAGFVGGSVPGYQNESRQRDLEARELRETTIAPGKSVSGFVYFALPQNETTVEGYRVAFRLTGPSGTTLSYDIPMAGRAGIPLAGSPGAEAPPSSSGVPPPFTPPSGPSQSHTPGRIEGAGGGVIIRSPAQ